MVRVIPKMVMVTSHAKASQASLVARSVGLPVRISPMSGENGMCTTTSRSVPDTEVAGMNAVENISSSISND